jgi:hypothetical protein
LVRRKGKIISLDKVKSNGWVNDFLIMTKDRGKEGSKWWEGNNKHVGRKERKLRKSTNQER